MNPDEFAKLPLRQRVKLMDQQYKKSRKDWAKPSMSFRDKSQRFSKAKETAPDDCSSNVKQFTISSAVGKKQTVGSAAFKDKRTQRDGVKAPSDVFYDPKDPKSIGVKNKKFGTGFASLTPRLPEDAPLDVGQQQCGLTPRPGSAPVNRNPKKGVSSSFAANGVNPRLAPTKPPICDQSYNPVVGTGSMQEKLLLSKKFGSKKGGAWSADTSKQRPEIKKPNDLLYNPKDPKKTFQVKAAHGDRSFSTMTPRFEGYENETPPPGQYASPFISAGMMS